MSVKRVRKQTTNYRPPRVLAWEKELPKPPRPVDVLREIIVSKVSYFQPKIFHELHQEVMDDYGPITDRAVYRNLKWLIKNDLIKRVRFEEDSCYIRIGRWKQPADCQTYVDTDTQAA